ncbi:sialate O-acetylesterase [Terrimonas sp. NA20]|uniref:Sialate O-acetylesterase n=1 Tax=Terrimonas ginsenosidimutans TaxID=2908004 RepID=A0ABS9KW34_9BACT|nr:sialate O-acetylesterase [Terrimonas ginsenosidimutans]MCG2616535.1 sialate O-acetylesterase [Terrimonas ginsenosidimutans]
MSLYKKISHGFCKKVLMIALMISPCILIAQVQLPSLFADNMILQRKSTPPIWGKSVRNAKISIKTSWNNKTYTATASDKGTWKVNVETAEAGGPYTITIKSGSETRTLSNVLLGEVWLCSGQSNMEMPVRGAMNQPVLNANEIYLEADNPLIRIYKMERIAAGTPQDSCTGVWRESSAEVVKYFSTIGYLYAQLLQKKLNVPVGIIGSYWGGSAIQPWMTPESLADFGIKVPADLSKMTVPRRAAASLYHGMIAPLEGYGIRGFLWYQGESNVEEPALYKRLLPALVKSWRSKWNNPELPFYYVQIAPYEYNGADSLRSAFLREAQLKALDSISNSGMAIALDAGEKTCIHPADKAIVARRLAYIALNKTYNFKGIAYNGPVYQSHTVTDGKVNIQFRNAENGITAYYKPVTLFEIAGSDKVFYPAEALITKEKGITVWSDKVKVPVAIRYAFRNWVKGEIYNNEGIPMSSFRTDDW